MTTQNRKPYKCLCFENVEIIEFPFALGDNPSVKDGAPLTIGWIPFSRTTYDIDYYEVFRDDRRGRKDLCLSMNQRTNM